MPEIIDMLLRFNPWWSTGKQEGFISHAKKRFLFEELKRNIKNKQILSITGIRRSGKTMLMQQLVSFLLEQGINPKTIIYFSFDEILAAQPNIIDTVLENYEHSILKNEISNVFVFFDEIQHIERWEVIVKRYYDRQKNIKFIVSGSSSLHLRKSKESLAGREYEFHLKCLSFAEFIFFKTDTAVEKIPLHLLREKAESLSRDLLIHDSLTKNDFMILFDEYIQKGGFPEIIDETDFVQIKKYVTSLIEKIVYKDIKEYFHVDQPQKLMEILKIIGSSPGMNINYYTLSSDLGLSRQTVAKYFDYLTESFILKLMLNYRNNALSALKKTKKAYFYEPSLLLGFFEDEQQLLETNRVSFVIENIIMHHLSAWYFWKNGNEVDIVFLDNNHIIPVEIKYKEQIKENDRKGIQYFMKEYKCKNGIIITKNILRKDADILYIPAWMFVLVT